MIFAESELELFSWLLIPCFTLFVICLPSTTSHSHIKPTWLIFLVLERKTIFWLSVRSLVEFVHYFGCHNFDCRICNKNKIMYILGCLQLRNEGIFFLHFRMMEFYQSVNAKHSSFLKKKWKHKLIFLSFLSSYLRYVCLIPVWGYFLRWNEFILLRSWFNFFICLKRHSCRTITLTLKPEPWL